MQILFLNPSSIFINRGEFSISSKLFLKIFPKLISPLLSKQHGTTVPSTSIAIWSFKAKQYPLIVSFSLLISGHLNSF